MLDLCCHLPPGSLPDDFAIVGGKWVFKCRVPVGSFPENLAVGTRALVHCCWVLVVAVGGRGWVHECLGGDGLPYTSY